MNAQPQNVWESGDIQKTSIGMRGVLKTISIVHIISHILHSQHSSVCVRIVWAQNIDFQPKCTIVKTAYEIDSIEICMHLGRGAQINTNTKIYSFYT